MAGVVGSRRDLIFVISELYYEVGGRHFVVGGKIAGCRHILTGLQMINTVVANKVIDSFYSFSLGFSYLQGKLWRREVQLKSMKG